MRASSSEGPGSIAVMGHITLRSAATDSVAPTLDGEQRAVVAHDRGPLLVLAGPGTGKTTTIVEAVAARLAGPERVDGSQVLVLTFSRLAAAELRARIQARIPAGVTPEIATFHSFAWRLLCSELDPDEPAPQLLSQPDAELTVRELLADPDPAWERLWPAERRDLLASAGMPEELLSLMSAARAQGWDPDDLAEARGGDGVGGPVPPEWPAAAAFFEHYLQILDWRGALDYSEVIHRARLLVARTPSLVGRYRAIYIDEYQDTDPAQVGLIAELATPDTALVAVGDPDQAIYRFRGADVGGILRFSDQFRDRSGQPARVVVLGTTRRFGSQIRLVADRWIAPVSLGDLPAIAARRHRSPDCQGPDGVVEVAVCRSDEDQAALVVDVLRRAHLATQEPLAWSQMAVLVRSATADIPRLERALAAAGVPVEVPAGERPLGHEPSLQPLLTGLRLADDPSGVSFADITAFLASPLVGMSPLQIRRMLRLMRTAERRTADANNGVPRVSAELLIDCFAPGGDLPDGLPADLAAPFDAVLTTIDALRAPNLDLSDRLWRLWSHGARITDGGGRWSQRLRATALAGGPGAQAADAALDAVMELFRLAERMPTGTGSAVFAETLLHHRVPAARGQDGNASQRDAVALLTAHRSKGAQWPLVVVVGLQQDAWPDARGPVTLLAPERIGPHGQVVPGRTRRELTDDERRLAFVAATRAQRRLVLTAVDSPGSDSAPSVLFTEAGDVAGTLATQHRLHPPGPRQRLTAASVVASLRSVLSDDQQSLPLRAAAARRLARLGSDHAELGVIAPQADPARWWGVADPTEADVPIVPADVPVALSATAVTGLRDCPLRWFGQRRVYADAPRSASASYGSLVHAAVSAVIRGELPANVAAMSEQIRDAFDTLPYRAEWEAEAAWARLQDDLGRFCRWWSESPQEWRDSEVPFDVVLPASPRPEAPEVRLTGSIDALAVGSDGAAEVVDFKTSASVPSTRETAENTQLGIYQLAVAAGATGIGDETAGGTSSAGASLVFLGKGADLPIERRQGPLVDDGWLRDQLDEAATTLRTEDITARVSRLCERCPVRSACPAQGHLDWIARP